MANTIKLKRGSGSNPGTSDLAVGEVALRTDNATLFTKNDAGNIAEIGASTGVSDGDKGDITVSSSGATWTIDNGVVSTAKIADDAVNSDKLASGLLLSAGTNKNIRFSGSIGEIGNVTGFQAVNDAESANTDFGIRATTIRLATGSAERLRVKDAGIDVTGNIAVSGTVDGVDIAARNTLFGGLTSSSGVLTNGVTATTQSASDNSTKIATTAYTDTAISNLVDSSPSALNTLNELAAALGDDANFSTTVTNSIATKLPLAGGTLTGTLNGTSATFAGAVSARRLTLSDDGANSPTFLLQTDDASPWGFTIKNDTYSTSAAVGFKAYQGNSGAFYIRLQGDSEYNAFYLRQHNGSSSRDLISFDTSGNAALSGSVTATGGFSGSGASLTSLSGSNISSGTIAAARVATLNQNTTGSAATLTTARTIGGTSFDGSANIDISYTNLTNKLSVGDGGLTQNNFTNTLKSKLDGIESGATADQTASEILTLIKTVDGSGSGLDADKLDGTEATKFLSSYDRTTTTGWQNSNGNFRLNGGASGSVGLAMHTSTGTFGYQLYGSGGTTYGFLNANWGGWDLKKTIDGQLQLRIGGTDYTVWNQQNDGSGSGLDADTLDGVQGSSFLRSDAADSATGTLTVRDILFSSGYTLQRSSHQSGHLEGGHINIGGTSTKTSPIYTIGSSYNPAESSLGNMYGIGFSHTDASFITTTGPSGWGQYVAADGDARVFLCGSNGSIWSSGQHYVGSNVVWNAGNDGSGSGLDADKWDGNQFSSYLNQAVLTSSGPTFSNVYNSGWFRNNDSTEGLYNTANGQHWYSSSSNYWNMDNDGTSGGIVVRDGHGGTIRGYVYYNSSNQIGFLDSGGNWRLYVNSSSNVKCNNHFVPHSNNSYDLGTSSYRWRNLYVNDLQLSNEARKDEGGNDVDGTWGDWTLQEGEKNIFMINNRSGKRYKMALQEV